MTPRSDLREFLRQRTGWLHGRGGLRLDRHDHRAGLLCENVYDPLLLECELKTPTSTSTHGPTAS